MTTVALPRGRREVLVPASSAAFLSALLVWLGPPGNDLAAHVYQRALYLQHGFLLWNNFWYAGRYSFVTYSLLYYPVAAAIGIGLLAVLTVAVAVAAFSALAHREYGEQSRWAAWAFALCWAALVVSGAYPFMLGSAFALVALCAVQRGHVWAFVVAAALTLASSPLAFLLLVVVLTGIALARRDQTARLVVPAVAVVGIATVEILLQRMFPGGGTFPFSTAEFLAVTAFCLIGLGLTWNVAPARILRWMFVAYLAACTATFAVSSPVGENIARLRFAAVPITILTLSLRRWKPWPVCTAVLGLALAWNFSPIAASVVRSAGDPAAHAAYWAPAISYLQRHVTPSYRVEAVDTAGHWPANFLAGARIPLARGWFRQEDFPQNRVLYGPLGPSTYLAWLRRLGVRYVVLTTAPPDYSARGEARLLASGRSGLKVVFSTPTTKIFEVPSPRPLVSSPARVLGLGYSSIRLFVPKAGRYRLAVTYSPYWETPKGCLAPTRDGMSQLIVDEPGAVRLHFDVTTRRALRAIIGGDDDACR
jgi:hypothetical protein